VLIFVFDPMAVMFVISYNVALEHRDEDELQKPTVTKKKKRWWEVYGEKKKEESIELETDSEDLQIETDDETDTSLKRGGFRRR
jgi:hypothetical protein